MPYIEEDALYVKKLRASIVFLLETLSEEFYDGYKLQIDEVSVPNHSIALNSY